jgi:lipopolysaccharide/colanic/teichoic acid biosynthesis glycosyltransferase
MGALITAFPGRTFALVVVDHLLVVAGTVIAYAIRLGPEDALAWHVVWRASLTAVVVQLMLHYGDLYDVRMAHDSRTVVVGLLKAFGAAGLVLAGMYYWLPQLMVGRGIVVIMGVLVVALMVAWRLLFIQWLSDVDDDATATASQPGTIGTIAEIPRIVHDRKVDRVVVSLADARGKFSMNELLQMKLNDGVRFDHLASVYERYTGKIAVENLRPSYLVFSEGFNKGMLLTRAKRALDVLLSVAGLAVFGPTMALVAVAVRLGSPGPALYRQERVGQNGKPFTVVKFRSMRTDAEAGTGAVWSQQNDPRVTRVGRILRRTRLDELPQLWNVLRGEMSFVGPRPERPQFVASLIEQIPFYGQRHAVRPGLTGWAQVRHSYGSTVEDAMQKLQYDLYYIKHLSIAFDLFIIIETVKTVLVRRGS